MFSFSLNNFSSASVKHELVGRLAEDFLSLEKGQIYAETEIYASLTILSVRQSRPRNATCLPKERNMLLLN